DRIEVIVPGKDAQTVADIKRKIVTLGSLEFYITVNKDIDDSNLIRQANELSLEAKKLTRTGSDGEKEVYAMWVPAYESADPGKPDKPPTPKDLDRSDTVSRSVEKIRINNGVPEKYTTTEYLVLVDPPKQQVTGKYLKSANAGIDPQSGRQIVQFNFDGSGAWLFSQLTSRF
ncbi:MAG: hypothetical protein GY826_27410, partial [Fuerstiella sp.]|nr:hypothetical protein [Fuerstiella sp.]